jgi:hypothetical protein
MADEIHLWQMIFTHGRGFEKLIFPACGSIFLALLVSNISRQSRKNSELAEKTEKTKIFLLKKSLNRPTWLIIVQYGTDYWEIFMIFI